MEGVQVTFQNDGNFYGPGTHHRREMAIELGHFRIKLENTHDGLQLRGARLSAVLQALQCLNLECRLYAPFPTDQLGESLVNHIVSRKRGYLHLDGKFEDYEQVCTVNSGGRGSMVVATVAADTAPFSDLFSLGSKPCSGSSIRQLLKGHNEAALRFAMQASERGQCALCFSRNNGMEWMEVFASPSLLVTLFDLAEKLGGAFEVYGVHYSHPSYLDGVKTNLTSARERARLSHQEMAHTLEITEAHYRDLEGHQHELRETISLDQLMRLCSVIGVRPIDIISTATVLQIDVISPTDLMNALVAFIQDANISVQTFEKAAGWEVQASVADPMQVWKWNAQGLIQICEVSQIDPWMALEGLYNWFSQHRRR